MSVTVRAKLPKGDTNGLTPLEGYLADNPDATVVVVGIVRPDTVESRPHDDDNPRVVKTILLHVEPVHDKAAADADRLLRTAYEARTGVTELPFESDDES